MDSGLEISRIALDRTATVPEPTDAATPGARATATAGWVSEVAAGVEIQLDARLAG